MCQFSFSFFLFLLLPHLCTFILLRLLENFAYIAHFSANLTVWKRQVCIIHRCIVLPFHNHVSFITGESMSESKQQQWMQLTVLGHCAVSAATQTSPFIRWNGREWGRMSGVVSKKEVSRKFLFAYNKLTTYNTQHWISEPVVNYGRTRGMRTTFCFRKCEMWGNGVGCLVIEYWVHNTSTWLAVWAWVADTCIAHSCAW